MSKNNRDSSSTDAPVSTAPAAESTPTSRKSTKATAPVKKPKPRYVIVENKLRQPLSLSVLNEDGNAEELKLGPLATSQPVAENRLTPQVMRLAESGKVRLR